MATDQLPDGQPQQRHAVVFGLYPGDPTFYTIVERDADSSGVPAGSETVVAWLPPGVRHYVEVRNATESFSHYRFRHGGFSFASGEPTAWYRARPVAWNGEIPNIPREPRLDLDLALDGTDGSVDVLVNGDRTVKSIEWDFSTSDYPADPSTQLDTDSEGDVTIADAFTLALGETGYVTVEFYDQVSSGGNLLGTLRASTTYAASGLTVPTIQEVISESANEGSLTLTVNDPDLLVTQVRFRTKVGKAAFSAWTAESVPAASYGPWTVALDAKHLSFIEYEVSYTLAGVSDIIQSAIAYDTDNIPELLSLSAHAGLGVVGVGDQADLTPTREAQIDYAGDSDTGSIRYAISTSEFPDRATTQAGSVNAGRQDFDVVVSGQESEAVDIYISVLAYSESDGTGTESTLLYGVILRAEVSTTGTVILNPDFDFDDPGEGSFWATSSDSTGVAIADSPTVGAGVDFQFDNDSESITIVQVTDDDDDITKSITL